MSGRDGTVMVVVGSLSVRRRCDGFSTLGQHSMPPDPFSILFCIAVEKSPIFTHIGYGVRVSPMKVRRKGPCQTAEIMCFSGVLPPPKNTVHREQQLDLLVAAALGFVMPT